MSDSNTYSPHAPRFVRKDSSELESKTSPPYDATTPPSSPLTRRVSCFAMLQDNNNCGNADSPFWKDCERFHNVKTELQRRNSDASIRSFASSASVHNAEPSHAELQRRLMAHW